MNASWASCALLLCGAAIARAQPAASLAGAWQGTLQTGAGSLRVVFHISETLRGLSATLDSPDQGARGIPVESIQRAGSRLTMEMPGIGGRYTGEIAPGFASIRGQWSQNGAALPLELRRAPETADLPPRRPQLPARPYPYREEEVGIENRAAHIRLAGTLTLPPGAGPFPAAVLITGSGPQDRDESLMGHKPFLVLADYLTRHGIAVLRADDRGTAQSGGDFAAATTADFATDAEACLEFLAARPAIDPRRIGLIGHSEGGAVASMVAARNRRVAFIVLLAGTGVPGDALLAEQARLITLASGAGADRAAAAAAMEREVLNTVKSEPDHAALERKLRLQLAGKMPEPQLALQLKAIASPWFRYFLDYDPARALRQVRCPVLALNGARDTQVSSQQNLPAIRRALSEGGNRNVEIDELPELNHLFQTAKTGLPSEYSSIEETMSPAVLEKIATWIQALPPPR